jgi:hypothetical protein
MSRTKSLIIQSSIDGIVFGIAFGVVFTFIGFKLYSVKQAMDREAYIKNKQEQFIYLSQSDDVEDMLIFYGSGTNLTYNEDGDVTLPPFLPFKNYDEYVNVCRKHQTKPRSKVWYYEKFPEQKPQPVLGMKVPDGTGDNWITYYDLVNFPTEQCRVVNGNVIEILDKLGNHAMYIMIDAYTSPYKDKLSRLHIADQIENHGYKQIEFEINRTFPDGDRVANKVTLLKERGQKEGGFDLVDFLFKKNLMALSKEEANTGKPYTDEQLKKFADEAAALEAEKKRLSDPKTWTKEDQHNQTEIERKDFEK